MKQEKKAGKMTEDNKLIMITGGSKGLGLAITRSCLAKGFAVAACARRVTPEVEALLAEFPDRYLFLKREIGCVQQERSFFEKAAQFNAEKVFWALINNAGMTRDGILATLPTVDIDQVLAVNLLGAIRLSRLASAAFLKANSGGRIINISSITALRGYTGLTAYAASKAGMDGMTRALARELGRRKITVNSIAPGYMKTDISAGLSAAQLEQIRRRTPLGELVNPSDVASLAMYLLSQDSSAMTGQTLVIDGGITT